MTTHSATTDYLIVGTGAVGMAFADVILSETDAHVTLIDRYAKPGGHWNVAYPFVTLHQPSAFYGVGSRELSTGHKDSVGLNAGLNHLASGTEVMAYFEAVMRDQFLPTGRVSYHPMCDYHADGKFTHSLTGQQHHVTASQKTVDATFLNTSVPATHTPSFSIAEGVQFIPLNDLPKIDHQPERYVVIGGGKTGIDACLWLLENQVPAEQIQWVLSRDAWMIDRKNTQPTMEFFFDTIGAQAAQFESIAQSESMEDMFLRLEKGGYFLRLDPDVLPSMFHGATISTMELEELRRIKNTVRLGRVTALEKNRMVLQQGVVETGPNVIHIDCSASALSWDLPVKPVFDGHIITPQTVRAYQPVFSAGLIAHIEVNYDDDVKKNNLCGVVPLPNTIDDFVKMTAASMMNQYLWTQDKPLRSWLLKNRLDSFSGMIASVDKEDAEKMALLLRVRNAAMPAMGKLQEYLGQISARSDAA